MLAIFWLLVVLTLFLFLLKTYPVFREWRARYGAIKGLPGPRQFFLGGILNGLQFTDLKNSVKLVSEWTKEYGYLFKLSGFPIAFVVANKPEYAQKLYGSKDPDHFNKNFIYDPIRPLVGDGLFTSTGEKWRSHRQPMSYINSFKNLQHYMSIFNKESHRIVSDLEDMFSRENNMSSILHVLTKSTLITVTESLFGRNLLNEDPTKLNEIIDNLDKFKELRDARYSNGVLIINPLYRIHPLSRQTAKVASELHQFWMGLIEEFLQGLRVVDPELLPSSGKLPLFQQMIRPDFSREELIHEALTMTAAGYETTGMTLQFLLFFLALHPEHQARCRAEVDELLSDADKCPDGVISQQHISRLKHLERCIYETLRFFPAVYTFMRKLGSPLKLDENLVLQKGTSVAIMPREIHFNPDIYPNPEIFDPSRFTPEECKARHPYAYLPFAAGPRKCIGFKFATLQMLVAAARILRHFEVSTCHALEDINITLGFKIKSEPNVKFNLKKRERFTVMSHCEA